MKLPKKRWLFLIVVIITVIGFVVYSSMHEELSTVQTDKVLKQKIVQQVSASGKVHPVEKVDISAYVSAEVTKLYVEEGQQVEKGQMLVELDSTRYRANRDQARAARLSAQAQQRVTEAQLLQSERILARTKELRKKDLVGEQELETAETAYKINKASLEAAKDGVRQAQAALRLAKDDLAKTTLNAPINGTISRLEKEVGEVVLGSQLTRDIIMTVADLSTMEVVVEVDENDVVDISLGDSAEIEVDAIPKEKFIGKVSKIGTSALIKGLGTVEASTNFEVTILVEDDVARLRPGMSATADIIVEEHEDTLSLPIQCVTMRDLEREKKKAEGGEVSLFRKAAADALKEVVFVYADGEVHVTEVKSGISSDTELEIVEGIEEGTVVVCGPYKTLHKELAEGQRVEVDNLAPTKTPEE
jgi:HlyD family secretion protein